MQVNELKINNYYINVDSGLCIYKGIQEFQGQLYHIFEYGKSEKLFLTENLVITKIKNYSNIDKKKLKLNRLTDNKDWLKTKEKAIKKAEETAEQLIQIYAERKNIKGFKFSPDTVEQKNFEDEFEFEPTPDQLKAVEDIKRDMESDKPMNRILIGDVGFGKTEVAIRATFKAVMDNKQIVVLAPTAVLASQHYSDFVERFSDFSNIKIGFLGGKMPLKEKNILLEQVKNNEINILIGTHSIISDNVKYKDLGLMIIDEEQRFGVTHKEKIKQMKSNIDVLSMSATPIPRTMYMSLAGITDISTLNTAPCKKKPIDTKVISSAETNIIKETIQRELDRDGQIFFIFNDTKNIESMKEELLKLIPSLKIGIVHGKMKSEETKKIMEDFKNKKYQLLLATTIIEVGITVKSANTIIIDCANKMGLSTLHQLRGRVGRGKREGYCLLVYNKDSNLNNIARERLKTLEENNALGSGSKIAQKDLEIRGAGEVIGTVQHGFFSKVGMDYYNEILENAIKQKKNETNIENVQITAC